MNEETITKEDLAKALLEVWKSAVEYERTGDITHSEAKAMVSVCKTLADEFGLTLSTVPLN